MGSCVFQFGLEALDFRLHLGIGYGQAIVVFGDVVKGRRQGCPRRAQLHLG